jgi:hypothetical protein
MEIKPKDGAALVCQIQKPLAELDSSFVHDPKASAVAEPTMEECHQMPVAFLL